MTLRNYTYQLVILTVAVIVVISAADFLFPFFNRIQIFSWIALAFFFMITLLTGYIGLRSLAKSAHGFVASVNGMVVMKLFLSIAFVIAYLAIVKPGKADFVASFFILYVIYTVFEIRFLVLAQKKQQVSQHANG